ncbi:MAG TPA: hypothetical protein VHY37_01490 [Tepidisphaeraceae bacterium]|nr:hypothetical protein [Tepidisphaeraceae bacterium]
MSEASLYFEGKGAVQQALQKITHRLHDFGIPYTVVGGLALFQHGYRRFTEECSSLRLTVHNDGPPGTRTGKELRMRHVKRTSVGHVQRKRPKQTAPMNGIELLDGHTVIIREIRVKNETFSEWLGV